MNVSPLHSTDGMYVVLPKSMLAPQALQVTPGTVRTAVPYVNLWLKMC